MAILENNNQIFPHNLRSIFRAYDIRGVVDELLTEDLCYRIGYAFASNCEIKKVVVGYDGRLSSPRLSEALCSGLQRGGATVFQVGLLPTPMLYFAIYYLGAANGIMVTGSHNPVQYNGLKLVRDFRSFFQDNLVELYNQIILLPKDLPDHSKGIPAITTYNVIEPYRNRLAATIGSLKGLTIAIDCAHGATAPVAKDIFEYLGCTVHALYDTVDGSFPAHHPDPSKPENLEDISKKVIETGSLVGLAFDGDGDRLGVVDADGRIITVDDLLALYSEEILYTQPGAKIVYDVKCGPLLERVIQDNGGHPIMCRTGHSYVKTKIIEENALLGGEMSGHIFFNDDWYGFDDGLYSAARLLKILHQSNKQTRLLEITDRSCTHELQLYFSEGEQLLFMNKFMKAKDNFNGAVLCDMDGLRVEYPFGWGLVRASNTTPSIVMRFEGKDDPSLKKIKDLFKKAILQTNPTLQLPFD